MEQIPPALSAARLRAIAKACMPMSTCDGIARCTAIIDETERAMLTATDPDMVGLLPFIRSAAVAQREAIELRQAAAAELQRLENLNERQGEARP